MGEIIEAKKNPRLIFKIKVFFLILAKKREKD
jgi:hypothetical protein